MMANSLAIPQHIIDNIIKAVDNPGRRFLETCALVSSSFLLPSRKRLFSQISLGSDPACQMFHQVLVENPVIQSFVRSIVIRTFRSHSLIAILRLPFCCLESFSIGHGWHYPADWKNFSSELKDALSTIIYSSTLKTLNLWGVISVPIMLFHGIHLTKLELTSFLFNDESTLLTSEASEGVASDTVIDQCVWNFYEVVHGTRFSTSAYFSLI